MLLINNKYYNTIDHCYKICVELTINSLDLVYIYLLPYV